MRSLDRDRRSENSSKSAHTAVLHGITKLTHSRKFLSTRRYSRSLEKGLEAIADCGA
ncbi:MAG: hypothetical protein HWQ38_01635 [Nostoc sp. NMS7]|uniref:hypothetical protein n=1 Tax=Nostoc sp. NMS7 TaxID=2815391 RepID=UPI0025F607CD|nr:hypothetical protein [Nostoc sp. NMS7]MBN3945246.1 hypothetical protein [Nostoc sp. NMS7]